MKLVGATAIEDKLQDGVPDAIANLAKVNAVSHKNSSNNCLLSIRNISIKPPIVFTHS
jgi:hypothetical protein